MLASVIIEYSVKSLNKVFDYMIPNHLKESIKVGNKVIVPFGHSNVEGFVLKIHDNKDNKLEYREITEIQESDFYLNEELLKLGKYMSDYLLCNLISCYQIMLPKALKASIKNIIFPSKFSKLRRSFILLNSSSISSKSNLGINDNIKIYPGHGPSSSVGYEKQNNYYLRGI